MSKSEADLKRYYSRRAPEYDAIYAKPERQADLAVLDRLVRRELDGRHVLEIACGTGHWTERIAGSARSVLATDASPRMLEMAARRSYPAGRVGFRQADAFGLGAIAAGTFSGCFAGFWWSHVPRARWRSFLTGVQARLEPGSRCVFLDNRYVHGESTPIARVDTSGDTYQDRHLMTGSTYRVLKNFPLEGELRACVAEFADSIRLIELHYFWCLSFDIRPAAAVGHGLWVGADGLGPRPGPPE